MADANEKKEEGFNLSSGLSQGLIFAIIGALVGVAFSFFTFIDAGYMGLSAMAILALVGAGFGFGLGFIYGIFPRKIKFVGGLIVMLALVLIVMYGVSSARTGGGILGFGQYLQPASFRLGNVGDALSGLKNYGYCFTYDPRCPYLAMWEEGKITEPEIIKVDVSFYNKKIINDEINLGIALKVNNPEEAKIEIKPKCYAGLEKKEELEIKNPGTYCDYNSCIFPQSEKEMSTSFRCFGATDKLTETVYVILERPVKVETTWPIKIIGEKQEKYEGTVRSESSDAPYKISLSSLSEIPFVMGETYDFSLIIKRKDTNVKFKKLDSLTITSLSEIYIDCEDFGGQLQLQNMEAEQLKQISNYDASTDSYKFLCSLYVADAPAEDKAISSPIIVKADYTVESEYRTTVAQQV